MFAEEISYYKLIKKLGSGGMGEVYLAEDTRLNRKVALKILLAEVAKDRKYLSRFWQEARLAANLNHPNICTIYEISDATETPFIAMEFVEGETLFDKIRNQSLELTEIIEIAVQIADALDEAHSQNVIHRDIKSANIIINRRGFAKVLDFGLAKTVIEEVSDEAVTQAKTEAGILVGTVQYMSPEQALGKTLDGRTDLWSFGVLLYEMVCSELPFKGDTQVAIFDAILHNNPISPSDFNENIPSDLEGIILKLIEKDRDFRYQTALDLRSDLKRLQRNTDEYFQLKTFEKRVSKENLQLIDTESIETNTDEIKAQNTSTIYSENSFKLWHKLSITLISLLLLAGTGIGIYNFALKKSSTNTFEKRETQKLTNSGKVIDAMISADGKYLAYVQNEGEAQSLWLKQLATGSIVQVLSPMNVIFQGITISADNNWIYYNVWDKKSVGEIFRVPILGGIPQKIIHDCMPGVDISPDSQQIAFIRSYDEEKLSKLLIANIETKQEKVISSRNRNEATDFAFAWAPDGKSLATLGSVRNELGEYPLVVSELSIENSERKIIWTVPSNLRNFSGGLIWKPNKSGILITLGGIPSTYFQIWDIDYPSGTAKQLTRDFNGYGRLSFTSDGKNLVSLQNDYFGSIWVGQTESSTSFQKITDGKIDGIGINWTPDGRLIYSSFSSGNEDIWIANADGSIKKQLTSDLATDTNPCVTADGKTIAFSSNRNSGKWEMWLMNIDGTNQKTFQPDGLQGIGVNACSKIDNSIYIFAGSKDKQGLWKTSLNGGEPKFLFSKSNFGISYSKDEKQIGYSYWNEQKKQLEQEISTFGTEKTEPVTFPTSTVGEHLQNEPSFQWTPDGKNLSFINVEKGIANIWTQPIKGGKPKKITNFGEYWIHSYSWSADGKKLAIMRGMVNTDVILIKDEN